MIVGKNATEVFEKLYSTISKGINRNNTKTLFNIGVFIENPLDRVVTTPWRKFSKSYAEREWNWYKSENPNAEEIAKYAPIWKNHMDENGNVHSNYGHQLAREGQLDYIVAELQRDPFSRRAVATIYDGKEHALYAKDTPCTQSVGFYILHDKLQMTVTMRSNDVWFGWCNDQYMFSKYQEEIASRLGIEVGSYFHFVTNMHIYNDFLNKNK